MCTLKSAFDAWFFQALALPLPDALGGEAGDDWARSPKIAPLVLFVELLVQARATPVVAAD